MKRGPWAAIDPLKVERTFAKELVVEEEIAEGLRNPDIS